MEIRWPSGCIEGSFGNLDTLSLLDVRYQGYPDGDSCGELRALEAWSQQNRIDLSGGCPPVLPSSARRLVLTVEKLADGRALFIGSDELLVAAANEGMGFLDPSMVCSRSNLAAFNTVVLSIPGPRGWLDALSVVLRSPPERLVLRVRAPYDAWCRKLVNDATVRHYYRDSEHHVLPGPVVLDGGGDLWVIEAIDRLCLDRCAAQHPRHSWRDLDGLDPDCCGLDCLKTFFELVERRYDEAVVFRDLRDHANGISGALYFASGVGLTLNIQSECRHALFSFHPYSAVLETTALSTVYECFGTSHLRSRPVRTMWSPAEMVF